MSATGTFSPVRWTRQTIMKEFRRSFADGYNVIDYAFAPKKNDEGYNVVYLALATPANEVIGYVITYFTRKRGGWYELVYRDTPEYWCPWDRKCPQKILDLLTPTDDADALRWRNACYSLCDVDLQDRLISIDGNIGGDMKRFLDIVREMYTSDCFLETDKCVDEEGNWRQYETTGEEWEWLCSFAK